MLVCKTCGESKQLSDFYVSNKSKCKTCVKAKVMEYRELNIDKIKAYDRNRPNHSERTEANSKRYKEKRLEGDVEFIEKDRQRIRDYRSRNPEKYKAQCCVNNALRDGLLIRPSNCSCCNKECKPQGHHWSYLEEHWLDVVWLCTRCHADEHKRLREIGVDPDAV